MALTPSSTIASLRAARLPAAWFQRDVLAVARELVGCALVHRDRAGVIVETEAYRGPEDAASHARFGRGPRGTDRTAVMFGPGGVAYVYLCYGIHEMFNIVTGPDGEGQAVLVRAIAPLVGLGEDPAVGRGPGKVTTSLALDRRHDGRDLAHGDLFVAAHAAPPVIATGPRVGVDYAGDWAAAPYRFWWDGNLSVSRTTKARARERAPRRREPAAPARRAGDRDPAPRAPRRRARPR